MNLTTCPSDNTVDVDQSSFWNSGSLHWDAHRIGWAIAGASTAVTVIISAFSVLSHCRNYTNPRHQRQIIRILYMPPVYAIISFLSYRFFRDYTYYSFVEVVYEAVTLSAFLLLLIQFVADHAGTQKESEILTKKKKKSFLFPFCCWRFNPTKGYFMYAVKWSVLQYVVIRPLVSIAGIICQALNVLCASQSFNTSFANVYLEAIDFVSVSIALYGLLVFYASTNEDLKGKKPLAKFLCIKLIVLFTFYQSFIFSALEGRVIKATKFWTATNIADGLNALAICIEMIVFAALMAWAYTYKEYKRGSGKPATGIGKPLWDSINYSDFAEEIWGSTLYFISKKRYAKHIEKRSKDGREATLSEAFNLDDRVRTSSAHDTEESESESERAVLAMHTMDFTAHS